MREAVEVLLSEVWGGAVALEHAEGDLSGRGHVHRLVVRAAPPMSPGTVVVKKTSDRGGEKYDPTSDNWVTTTFFNEWASLQLLTELCAEPPGPRLYGGSVAQGFLVMEDLGKGPRLDDALLGSDPGFATETLVALFETMGRMHAATIGKRARFEEILSSLRPPRPMPDETEGTLAAIAEVLQALGVTGAPRFRDELAAILDPTATTFDGLRHGDPCPDNCHWVGGRVRLLDFEHGRFRNVFGDACYPRVHFPTCWCIGRLPEQVSSQALAAYRRALDPRLDDATFERELTDASVRWVWTQLGRWHGMEALQEDRTWGLATVRQRIVFRLGLLGEMLERNGLHPAIAETTRRALEACEGRWPELPPMPLYRAFSPPAPPPSP
jgi:hypothetical protein